MTGRDERGTALVEVVWLSVLLLVPLVYVVLAVFEVQRTAYAVTAATAAAARAYSLAPSQELGRRQASIAAGTALGDQGLAADAGAVRVSCQPAPGDCLRPGSVVLARLDYQVALPLLPYALGGHTPSIRVSAEQRVPVGRFREGRP
ncbi:MAG: hypothetical protein WB441_09465 [Nocardioidaceae bacterium]